MNCQSPIRKFNNHVYLESGEKNLRDSYPAIGAWIAFGTAFAIIRPYPLGLPVYMYRTEDLLIVLMMIAAVMATPRYWYLIKWSIPSISLLLMGISFTVSLFCGVSHSFRDYMDVTRYYSLIIFVFYGMLLYGSGSKKWYSLPSILIALSTLNVILSCLQYYSPSMMEPIMVLHCSNYDHIQQVHLNYRVIGVFSNPNTNGLMSLLFSCGLIFLWDKKRGYYWLFTLVLLAVSTLLTSSRTASILLALLYLYVLLFNCSVLYRVVIVVFLGVTYPVLGLLWSNGYVLEYLPYMAYFIDIVINDGEGALLKTSSFAARTETWEDQLSYFYVNPILGAGPLRSVIQSCSDNYYIYLVTRFGLMGLLAYFLFTLSIIGMSVRMVLTRSSTQAVRNGNCLLVMTLIILVANIAMDAFPAPTISALYTIVVGYVVGAQLSNRSRS